MLAEDVERSLTCDGSFHVINKMSKEGTRNFTRSLEHIIKSKDITKHMIIKNGEYY